MNLHADRTAVALLERALKHATGHGAGSKLFATCLVVGAMVAGCSAEDDLSLLRRGRGGSSNTGSGGDSNAGGAAASSGRGGTGPTGGTDGTGATGGGTGATGGSGGTGATGGGGSGGSTGGSGGAAGGALDGSTDSGTRDASTGGASGSGGMSGAGGSAGTAGSGGNAGSAGRDAGGDAAGASGAGGRAGADAGDASTGRDGAGGANDAGPVDAGGSDGGIVCTSGTTWTSGNNAAMRPGDACRACHSNFTIAGTVYPTAHEPLNCNGKSGVQVVITPASGTALTLTTNAAGNFYSTAKITTPYTAKVVMNGAERPMTTAQTSGDCNSCHTQNGAQMAPGRIMTP